jgi:hypothetical protein
MELRESSYVAQRELDIGLRVSYKLYRYTIKKQQQSVDAFFID